jgi:sortase A
MNPDDQSSDLPQLPLPNNRDKDDVSSKDSVNVNPAADMIRQKLDNIYNVAPKATKELEEIKTTQKPLTKHQAFVADLQKHGKTLAQIQSAWNAYYSELSDKEKHEVWQEFYEANKQHPVVSHHTQPHYVSAPFLEDDKNKHINQNYQKEKPAAPKPKSAAEIKKRVLSNVQHHSKKKVFRTLHSLAFGLGVGLIVVIIFLFSFFNDRFLAPFITPSRDVSAQALITDPNAAVGPDPIIIIPKINVEIPVIYSLPTDQESDIENSLQDGVVHYPTTPYPGQLGNGAIFGHSSNNILNPGKYKFAFVLLHDLVVGDTFTLDYQGKAYVYQIFQKIVVPPSDVSVLNTIPNKPATFSLITCDPPGTSINRLVVVGEQVSPDPSGDAASNVNQNAASKPTILPSNAPSLWSRVLKFFHL